MSELRRGGSGRARGTAPGTSGFGPAEIEDSLGGLRVYRQSGWLDAFPWLIQGVTAAGERQDYGPMTGSQPRASTAESGGDGWGLLQSATRIRRVARCRQVHGSGVLVPDVPSDPGVHLMGEGDSLITSRHGVVLAVTIADCIPVFMVEPERRILGLAHAGWRGVAAGVAEATLERIVDLGGERGKVCVHLGPAICVDCYEVGPEVASALGYESRGKVHVDLRGVVSSSLMKAGIDGGRLTVSGHCTRHHGDDFFSYRGGDGSRRMCAFVAQPAG